METIGDILRRSTRRYADAVALQMRTESGRWLRCRFGELGRRARAMAGQLRREGVGQGTRVALLGENGPEWPVAYFAVHLSGATLVPLDPALGPLELRNILRAGRVGLVIAAAAQLDLAREACREGVETTLLVLEEVLAEARACPAATDERPLPRPAADDVAVISFTSGTTGAPKGVMLTHRNIVSNVLAASKVVHFDRRDHFLSLLPLNHMFEQTVGLLVPLHCGARVTYLHSRNPRTVLETLREEGVTIGIVVPALVRLLHKRIASAAAELPPWRRALWKASLALANAAGRRGLPLGRVMLAGVRRRFGPRMRLFVSGGAALDDHVAAFFARMGLPVLQGYGLSETAPVVSCNRERDNRIGSVGRPIDGVEVAIAPAEGQSDERGEVLVRGHNVMVGYFEDPRATRDVLQHGWLRTGDIGWMDEDGYLYLCGRVKDVIVGESGKNIYPEEVESEIAKCDCIREACVLARRVSADGGTSEEPVAVVVGCEGVLNGRSRAEALGLIRRALREVLANLAPYKRPRWIALWEGDLPRTTTLKVKKALVARRLAEGYLGPL